MAYKRLGGWLIPGKLYAQAKIANDLWYFSRRDDSGEKQVSLFFIGWYECRGSAKLFTINILWLSFQVGFAI